MRIRGQQHDDARLAVVSGGGPPDRGGLAALPEADATLLSRPAGRHAGAGERARVCRSGAHQCDPTDPTITPDVGFVLVERVARAWGITPAQGSRASVAWAVVGCGRGGCPPCGPGYGSG